MTLSLWSVSSIWFSGATINGTEAEDQAVGQDAEQVRKPDLFIWFVWFVSFVWLNETTQMNQLNQIN
jgi:hypothetical protein